MSALFFFSRPAPGGKTIYTEAESEEDAIAKFQEYLVSLSPPRTGPEDLVANAFGKMMNGDIIK